MAVIDTIPTTDVTLPKFVADRRSLNGKFDQAWLRCPDARGTSLSWRLFTPVSYAMTALQLEAIRDGVSVPLGNSNVIDTTGRYRTYERQVALFYERYTLDKANAKTPYVTRWWEGKTWYLKKGMAMAATPGTSNHGYGLADDVAEDPDSDDSTPVLAIDAATLTWMRDNAPKHGFSLDTRSEPWHWHWYMPTNPNTLTQHSVDVLYAAGIVVPDLSAFGFTVPKPTTIPPPTPPSSGTYTVVAGDSWWGISRKLGCSMDDLIAANPPATTSTVIHPGDVLNVPGSTSTLPPPPDPPPTDWAEAGAQMTTPPANPVLRLGVVHDNVPWLQAVLSSLYTIEDPVTNIYNPAWVDADSIAGGQGTDNLFGNATKNSLSYWQSRNGLTADGVYGQQTASKMAAVRGR